MGGVCCSEQKKYRFKGFVVSVYPEDVKGGPNEDALGKLNNYIGSNPERVPRVCRKISKILRVHLQARKVERVMVSIKMLCSLIEHAKSVDGFVPHSIDMCAQLLATSEVRYQVGAADILCALCIRLTQDPQSEPSRRLIADSKDRLLPPLRVMCAAKGPGGATGKDGSPSAANTVALQSRYAAVVAIGRLAHCLGNALAGNVSELLFPIVSNLLLVLKNRSTRPVSEDAPLAAMLFDTPARASISGPTAITRSGGPAPVTGPSSAEVSKEERYPDLAYARACIFAVGATAGCVTAAHVEPLTERLLTYMTMNGGWAVPAAPLAVFRALVAAMEERPQGLGFTVFQCLCREGDANTDPIIRIGILSALEGCVLLLPMSGGRPELALRYLRAVILAAPVGVKDANTKPTLRAIVALTESLLQSVYVQRNAPQLQSVLAVLVRLLSDSMTEHVEPLEGSGSEDEDEGSQARPASAELLGRRRSSSYGQGAALPAKVSPRIYLILRCVDAAAPYVRAIPLIDRETGELDLCGMMEPLLSSGDDGLRTWAARILRGILAGIPPGGDGSAAAAPLPTAATAAATGTGPRPTTAATPSSATALLSTDERDVAFAQAWVRAMMADTTTVTPRCIVEVGGVLTAIMAGYGVSALPFILTTLWALQNRCVSHSTVNDPNSANIVTSSSPTSPLTRAWLQAVLATLVRCGEIYEIPKLTEYALGILRKRQVQPSSELATCFEPELRESSRAEHRLTVCGLVTTSAAGARKDVALSAEPILGPVTKLPSFSFIANVIVDADRADVLSVFGVSAANDLKVTIERLCFSAASVATVALDKSDSVSNVGGKLSELRDGTEFALEVSPAQLIALRELHVVLVDRPPTTLPIPSGAEGHPRDVREALEQLSVDAHTNLLAPGTRVDDALPLFDVSLAAHRHLASRGRAHDRRLGHHRGEESEGSERGPVAVARDDSSTASADLDALRAQATLAEIGDDLKPTGALAMALKMQREAQEGDEPTPTNGNGVPARRPWFSMLPSSRYVDLE